MPVPLLRRQLLRLTAVIGLTLCSSTYAADWALPDLMRLLAQKKSGKASFIEKKYISILDQPVESSGELSFDAPDRLEKRTLKPQPEVMLLDGDRLTISLYEKRPIFLSLKTRPEIAALIESIRGTLSGDLSALEKNYAVDFSGGQNKWRLTLTPLQTAASKVVSQIQIAGNDANVKTITFTQVDGDRSEMTISKVVTP
jgi:outer membrane lipoprotein-sorting protein